MTPGETAARGEEPRSLDDLLLEWEQRLAAGEAVSPEELCADAPNLLAPLKHALERLLAINRVLELPACPASSSDLRSGEPLGPGVPPGEQVTTTTSYRVERWVARGGQGDVFLARDEAMGREVALKFLRLARGRSSETEARFLREARITGRLDHPGLVPVHGVGVTHDATPCYAMRWIRGETLAEAVDRLHQDRPGTEGAPAGWEWELRALLTRFVSVCNTVAYAHSRGVVHRDLKPVNILLGPFGETLVVDWGLARETQEAARVAHENTDQADDSFESSLAGRICGTPGYMSPEQARGDWSAIGPASDQFNLGATLYQILTGRAPYTGRSAAEAVGQASRGDHPKPRTLQPNLSRALEAICLKAMAPRLEDRYPSVKELGADVERWLSDAPVLAFDDPWTVRIGRWARQHRTPVAAALALLATATIALSVSTLLIGREQQRTSSALQDASTNFNLARDAVDQLGARIGEERLLNEPGMEDLRHELLQSALHFYERFAERSQGEPGLIADLGRARARVAAIRLRTGTPSDAIADYRQAVALLRQAIVRRPSEASLLRDLASTFIEYAGACQKNGLMSEGEDACRDALDVENTLRRRFLDDPEAPRTRARALHTLGTLQLAQGFRDRAESTLRSAISLEDRIVAGPDPRDEDRDALGQSLNNLAVLHRQAGRLSAADALYRRCLEVKRSLVASRPQMAGYGASLAATGINHSRLLDQLGKPRDGLTAVAEAQATLERLVEDYPRSTDFRFHLGQSHLQRGLLLLHDSQPAEAEREWQAAESILSEVDRMTPGVERYLADLTNARTNLANRALDRGDLEAAQAWASRASEGLAATRTRVTPGLPSLVAEVAALRAGILERRSLDREAARDWELAAASAQGAEQTHYRIQAARALARAGEAREAHQRLESFLAHPPRDSLLDLAAALTLAAAAASNDPTIPAPERQATRDRWADEAIDLLLRAQSLDGESGKARIGQRLDQSEFETLRNHPGYSKLRDAR